jgi:hypothetical protein
MTERQIEKIKKTIKFYRSKLAVEKRIHGDYDDSAGLRYIITSVRLRTIKNNVNY